MKMSKVAVACCLTCAPVLAQASLGSENISNDKSLTTTFNFDYFRYFDHGRDYDGTFNQKAYSLSASKQKMGDQFGQTFVYSDSGQLTLSLSDHRPEIENVLFEVSFKAAPSTSRSSIRNKVRLDVLHGETAIQSYADLFGASEQHIQLTVTGKTLMEGLVFANQFVTLDNIKVTPTSKLATFDFYSASRYSHGQSFRSQLQNGDFTLTPTSQKAGNRKGQTFVYPRTVGQLDLKLNSQAATYDGQVFKVTALAGASTGQAKNKDKVKLSVFSNEESIAQFQSFFGNPKKNIEFTVTSEQLRQGISLKNAFVTLDDITVESIGVQKEEANTPKFNFDFAPPSTAQNGDTVELMIEHEGFDLIPHNQYYAVTTQAWFGKEDSSFTVVANGDTEVNPDADYDVTFHLGSATKKHENGKKVKSLVSNALGDELFKKTNWYTGYSGVYNRAQHFTIRVSGQDLQDGLTFENSLIEVSNLVIEPVKQYKNNALLIGIGDKNQDGDYLDHAEMASTVNDATAMEKMLSNSGYNTNLMHNISTSEFSHYVQKAAEQTASDGKLIVYIASHGRDSRGGGIWFNDHSIDFDDLKTQLDKYPGEKVVILESCGSGKGLKQFENDPTYTVVTSSNSLEFSWAGLARELDASPYASDYKVEREGDGVDMGYFTYYITQGAGLFNGGNAVADTNQDGTLTLQEAFDYANQKVLDMNMYSMYKQHPQSTGTLNGAFIDLTK
ncbi:caspase family protein [Vibrio sp. RE86]|uniref:caspase family protein n=1 Tax=Vibrio sp. RE86 TaxID=2607605 RepID=UPI0014933ACE|nr:caspase family protein [Vibrio sp. RE86]